MKTYVITLEKNSERSRHIRKHVKERKLDYSIIPAVDGSLLTEEELNKCCNMEKVNKLRWWLTNGAIGCALSHLKAYEIFLKTNDTSAFIIEDDALLPENINEILHEIENEIKSNEIILLYYTSFKLARISKIGKKKLSYGGLYYPLDIKQPITATAYIVGRQTAENLKSSIKPIEVTADCWQHFYEKGTFSSLRLHYPSVVSTKNFKSSIDYLKEGSLIQTISSLINNYKIPFLYQLIKLKRKRKLNKMLNQFILDDAPSPLQQ